ncbi:hypothetical protein IPT12_15345 [Xanthomonas perforans]|uniref:hypothetical protein n=1 Tax=Xanthomonas perforans TaxID=442694 RepID=UPI000F8EABC7|nr:hypothetical protein [Xanthomonas perforans]MBZ2413812.1 hypothetical protein [Xanthomonas perforans]MBZ2422205.1 hypothetical protein [Xanthomonas perforans]MBZ2426336.1 hypothetical protein [Xanthomonas perforans]MBZ2451500.1 hypothetical protein [Xanthomonas perforans]MBZ2455584.1 hypothetical protein [Xanthomonas perforans]
MVLNCASGFRQIGAWVWTRYLLKSLECDVEWLNRTLLFPCEGFTGAIYEGLTPRVFEEIHYAGKNPDGAYWKEIKDKTKKFNLLERVCERVPASRAWLLRDFNRYMQLDPPSLLDSREQLLAYTNSRGLLLVPGRVMAAVKHLDPELYADLEHRCTSALIKAATPSTLLFVIAFLHEVTWRRHRGTQAARELADNAVTAFSASMHERAFEDGQRLGEQLRPYLQDAVANVSVWGDRSAPSKLLRALGDLWALPFLMRKNQDMLDACACLHAAGEAWYERIDHPLPERYRDGALEVTVEGLTSYTPSHKSIKAALIALRLQLLKTHGDILNEYNQSLLITASTNPSARANSSSGPR